MNSRDKAAVWIVGIIMTSVVLMNIFYGLESYTYKSRSLSEFSEIARNFGLILLGLIGLPLAIWRSKTAHDQAKTANDQAKTAIRQSEHTATQIALAQQGQLADRFQKASEMLGSDSLSVREAGIFALKELVRTDQSDIYYLPVQELLCAFIRAQSTSFANEHRTEEIKEPLPPAPSDIRTAIFAFSELRTPENCKKEKAADWKADLQKAYLVDIRFERKPAHLQNADLRHSILQRTFLQYADISNSNLSFSEMSRVCLDHAEMRDSYLIECCLLGCTAEHASFRHSKLARSNFTEAILEYASFYQANLNCTQFQDAGMINASFPETRLDATMFNNCDLAEANFSKARLISVRFKKVDTEGANFEGAQLRHMQDFTFLDQTIWNVSPVTAPYGTQFVIRKKNLLP